MSNCKAECDAKLNAVIASTIGVVVVTFAIGATVVGVQSRGIAHTEAMADKGLCEDIFGNWIRCTVTKCP